MRWGGMRGDGRVWGGGWVNKPNQVTHKRAVADFQRNAHRGSRQQCADLREKL